MLLNADAMNIFYQ